MRKRLFLTVFLLLSSGIFAPPSPVRAGEKPIVIGVCVMGLRHPYFRDMLDEMEKEAATAGVELDAGDADFNNERQTKIIEGYIAIKASMILVAPFDAKALLPTLEKARKAGIPVMTVDAAAPGFDAVSHCASDNVAGGRLAGGLLLERLIEHGVKNGGRVLAFEHAGVTTTTQRIKGFRDVMALRGGEYDIEVVDAVGQTSFALAKVKYALETDKDKKIVAMFCSNDGMTQGALQAVEDSGRGKDMVVVGYDYVEEAKKAVDEGRLAGIVVQFPRRIGKTAFAIAHEYVTGKNRTPPKEVLVEVGTYTREGFLDQRGNPIR